MQKTGAVPVPGKRCKIPTKVIIHLVLAADGNPLPEAHLVLTADGNPLPETQNQTDSIFKTAGLSSSKSRWIITSNHCQ
jgi:hypothetical protein